MRLPVRILLEDAERANDVWGCNCGPAALAAITGLTLDQIRPHMGDFERKRYTNPTLMFAALKSVGVKYLVEYGQPIGRYKFPQFGLARIQWEGPWTKPGVPIRVRYRQTHWVAAQHGVDGSVGIFDINCVNNGSGWTSFEVWRDVAVPWILEACVPRADGKWHITHSIEIEPTKAGDGRMMLKLTDDLTINAANIASVQTDQRHYMNGPGDSTLIITMDDGRQHRIRHGYGVDIYAIKKQIEAA